MDFEFDYGYGNGFLLFCWVVDDLIVVRVIVVAGVCEVQIVEVLL